VITCVVVLRDLLTMQEVARMRQVRNVLEPLGLGAGRLTRDELSMVVSRIAADQSLWRPLVRHNPARRWYGRLHLSPTLEVWLLGWECGQDTRLHDHGGSSGAFSVVDGTLGEEYGHVERWTGVRRRTHAAGKTRSFGPGYVHNLGNDGTVQATSIHAYSPPLSTMTYYRPEDRAIVPYETVITSGPDEGIDVEQAAAGGYLASAGS
jgi:predicted metal-dependent enzyme (double-stranded beta helix superfamily)